MTTQPLVVVPSLSDFETALVNVRQIAIETPTLHSKFLSDLVGQQVFLKCENLQRTGAYKVRGAFNRMSHLTAAEKKKGVIAASAGNHSQGVALAAKKLGIKATVYMPIGASLPKVEATRNYGARVVQQGGPVRGADLEVQLVELRPHLVRDLVARGAGVLTRFLHA